MKRHHTGHVNHAEGSLRYWYGQFMWVSRQCKPSVHPQGDSILEGLVKQLYIIHRCGQPIPKASLLIVHDAEARSGSALGVSTLDGVGRGGDLTNLGSDGSLTLPESRRSKSVRYSGELLVLNAIAKLVTKPENSHWQKLSSLS